MSVAVGVGQSFVNAEDEEALAFMRRASFCRREEASLNRVTQLAKVSTNSIGASDFVSPGDEHSADVLDPNDPWPDLDDDAARWRPEIALVELALLPTCVRMGLARNAANDCIHKAAPRPAVEGSGIAPYRSWSQETRPHR